jgi:hypothetical protein
MKEASGYQGIICSVALLFSWCTNVVDLLNPVAKRWVRVWLS